jgi:hypothetical protein
MQKSPAAVRGSLVLSPDLFAPTIEVDARGKVNTGKVVIGLTYTPKPPNPRMSIAGMHLQTNMLDFGLPVPAERTWPPAQTKLGRLVRWFWRSFC